MESRIWDDIDVVARDKAWEKACTISEPSQAAMGNNRIVLFNGEIEIFDGWVPGDWNIDELIKTSDVLKGVRFVTLENVIKWKRIMGRDKDFKHIQIIEKYLRKNS